MQWLKLILLALGLLVGLGSRAAAQAPDGQALYRQHCRTCHGAKGTPPAAMVGVYPALSSFADPRFAQKHSEAQVVAVLEKGGKDMPPFRERLSKEEIAAVATYVRKLGTPSPDQ